MGSPAQIAVSLWDATGRPVAAPRDLQIAVESRPITGQAPTRIGVVTIAARRSAGQLAWTPQAPGPVEIRARHPELSDGRTICQVTVRRVRRLAGGALFIQADWQPEPARAAPRPPAQVTLVPPRPGDRTLVGTPFTLFATLPHPLPRPVRVVLQTSGGGQLLANGVPVHQLVIPPGETIANLDVKADAPGDVTVGVIQVDPPLEVHPSEFAVHFQTQCRLALSVEQTALGLFEKAPVTISARDIAPENPWDVKLAVDGRGRFEGQPARVAAEKPLAVVTFLPTWVGSAVVSANSISAQPVKLSIAFPWGLMLLTAAAAALSGLLVWRRYHWTAAGTGAALGLTLFWALSLALLPYLPGGWRVLPGNPLSAFLMTAGASIGVAMLAAQLPGRWSGRLALLPLPGPPRPPAAPRAVFISYAHADSALCEELKKHLAAAQREGLILTWTDRMIEPGMPWDKCIHDQLDTADLYLLLISADFIASNYCMGIEFRRAYDRAQASQAIIVPIIVRSCDWQAEPFAQFQALPSGAQPVTSEKWHSHDDAFSDVAKGLRHMIEEAGPARAVSPTAV